jgi:hypothetical protein
MNRPLKRPTRRTARRAERRRGLPPDSACVFCGITDPDVLRLAGGHVLEQHHPMGREHDSDFTVPLCLTDHMLCSLGQWDDSVPLGRQQSGLDRAIAALQALASFFRQCWEAIGRLVANLVRHRDGLNASYPDWSTHSWAR